MGKLNKNSFSKASIHKITNPFSLKSPKVPSLTQTFLLEREREREREREVELRSIFAIVEISNKNCLNPNHLKLGSHLFDFICLTKKYAYLFINFFELNIIIEIFFIINNFL